jgi:hypothetical protein
MTIRLIALLLILVSTAGFSDDSKKTEPSATEKPCLFFADMNTGEPAGEPANAPCDLDTTRINPGDTVDPKLRKKYGKVFKQQSDQPQGESDSTQ